MATASFLKKIAETPSRRTTREVSGGNGVTKPKPPVETIRRLLRCSLSHRFQDLRPDEFEDFVAWLFQDSGYEVQQTPISGDFGADLILAKAGKKSAVQVKRYKKSNKVGVSDVNQLIGAKQFYYCDSAIMVTTSSYSAPAQKLLAKSGCEFWDWSDLYSRVCSIYLEGQDHFEYFPKTEQGLEQTGLEFKITRIRSGVDIQGLGQCTLVVMDLANLGTRKREVDLNIPVFISPRKRQYEADAWYENYFSFGVIYPGCTVEAAFLFRSENVPKVPEGSNFVIGWTDTRKNKRQESLITFSKSSANGQATALSRTDEWGVVILILAALVGFLIFGVDG